jgi:16S rRNA (cytosine1402-N4)-methyltransferase
MDHYSVLLKESIDGLSIQSDGIYVDCTLGRAGHSCEILKQLTAGHLYAFDKDVDAINASIDRLALVGSNFTIIKSDFRDMVEQLSVLGVQAVDGILMDLGVSSPQFDQDDRGFSYRFDGRLDMRMDRNQVLTAYEVVNNYSFNDLVRILYQYGEEANAKLIARGIEKYRQSAPIETTFQLVEVIKKSLPMKVLSKKGHPAKQTFQAIRMEVNQELQALEVGLSAAIKLLKPNGRLCVITFHSLEDKIVKHYFQELTQVPKIDKRIPLKANQLGHAVYELINKKPIVASEEELAANHRSHSAKLRIIKKL